MELRVRERAARDAEHRARVLDRDPHTRGRNLRFFDDVADVREEARRNAASTERRLPALDVDDEELAEPRDADHDRHRERREESEDDPGVHRGGELDLSRRHGEVGSPSVSEALPSAELLPRPFGKYVLVERIGQGGMAEIFVARTKTELGAERAVVIKLILPALAAMPRFAEMLVAEAKLASKLAHANVVQILDLGRESGRLYIAMEYVEGLDLAEVLRRCSRTKTPLPVEFALFVVIEALRGLEHAHRRVDEGGRALEIVHRDVSPSNVIVSFEGEVKLCDFGIAHAADAARASGEELTGKAGYMSPEHARGEALDARADVFAAGILLWELLAGRRYYKADEDTPLLAVAQRAVYRDPPARGLANEDELLAVVRAALATDREERTPSAQAMRGALEAYVARAGLVASPLRLGTWMRETLAAEVLADRRANERRAIAAPAVEPRPTAKASKRSRAIALASVAALVILALAAALVRRWLSS